MERHNFWGRDLADTTSTTKEASCHWRHTCVMQWGGHFTSVGFSPQKRGLQSHHEKKIRQIQIRDILQNTWSVFKTMKVMKNKNWETILSQIARLICNWGIMGLAQALIHSQQNWKDNSERSCAHMKSCSIPVSEVAVTCLWGRDRLFNKWCWKNWLFKQEKIKPDLYSVNRNKFSKVNSNTLKFIGRKREYLFDLRVEEDLVYKKTSRVR
jgi:hypothetical protein